MKHRRIQGVRDNTQKRTMKVSDCFHIDTEVVLTCFPNSCLSTNLLLQVIVLTPSSWACTFRAAVGSDTRIIGVTGIITRMAETRTVSKTATFICEQVSIVKLLQATQWSHHVSSSSVVIVVIAAVDDGDCTVLILIIIIVLINRLNNFCPRPTHSLVVVS